MSHILAPGMFSLFNMSIMEGILHSCLKIGYVIPILKSGKKIRGLMRSISTLPIIANFFKKLALNRMTIFNNRFNHLNSNHFGFLSGRNTFDALTKLLDKVYDAINQFRV